MGKCFTLQILRPIEGYVEDKIYEREDITLRIANCKQKPDDVYYIRLKDRSVYASFSDIVEFACQKYSLGEIHNFSMHTDHWDDREIEHEGNRYIVTAEEVEKLEREHIAENVYCNVFKECRLNWFYTSIGNELIPEDFAIVDDELIQDAMKLLEYESEEKFVDALVDVIDNNANGEDKFIASLLLAKEIANCINGRAILKYE